jgi:hypothetical protein
MENVFRGMDDIPLNRIKLRFAPWSQPAWILLPFVDIGQFPISTRYAPCV